MKHLMVRYTTRADRAEENARLIADVFESLRQTVPAGLTYSTYRLDDGVSFIHVASVDDPDNNPLRALEAFQKFTSGVRDRCEIPPATTNLTRIGHYSSAEHAAARETEVKA